MSFAQMHNDYLDPDKHLPQTEECGDEWDTAVDALQKKLKKVEMERDKWKQQYQTVTDERAASFLRIGRALGGMSLTEYQPEVDLEIEAAARAAREDVALLDWADANNPDVYWEKTPTFRERLRQTRDYTLARSASEKSDTP